jgi:integrase
MARTVRDANIGTRNARMALQARPEPYWRIIEGGLALGYRRNRTGGVWLCRRWNSETRRYVEHALGASDDLQDADGISVHSFTEAQNAARVWWKAEERRAAGLRPDTGPYTVKAAIDDYLTTRERRGSKGVKKDRYAAEARINPGLGSLDVAKLTTKRIRDWHASVVSAARLVRTKKTSLERATVVSDSKDANAVRRRRSTANRLLTILKAALNHAFHDGRVSADDAWRKAKPYREVDAPVVRFLSVPECIRLVNACEPAFRQLVRAALVTGCRYGELTRMRAADFNAQAGTISVLLSKAGKARHVALNDEGQWLFASLTDGRTAGNLIFRRADGGAWGPSHQQRPLDEASRISKLNPPATFHILRHTYASTLAMKGVPMGVIAAQLGHSDTRMTERHYAHLAPSYVANTIRAALPSFGILQAKCNVLEPKG